MAAHGLHGLHAFLAAHGLHGLHAFLAAHGLHGLQAFLAAHGLHGLQAFLAAHGLHGLQALAAQGLHGLQAASCVPRGFAFATGNRLPAAPAGDAAYPGADVDTLPAITNPAPTNTGRTVVDKSLDLIERTMEPPLVHCFCICAYEDVDEHGGRIKLRHRVTLIHIPVMLHCGSKCRVYCLRSTRGHDPMPVLILAILYLVMALLSPAAPASSWTPPETILIPAGSFVTGSDRAERDAAYRLDEEAYGHSRTRDARWYESDRTRRTHRTRAYRITRTPITNREYAEFVAATGHPAPDVDPETWAGYALVHPYARTRRHAWTAGRPPLDRADHPVVLVSLDDARAHARWLSGVSGGRWRLPTEEEWEKAARGTDGRRFPWGDHFDPRRLNSHDEGPFDTVPVGRFAEGNSPFGLMDAAGQVFEWTSTTYGNGRYVVKGGSWDDKGCGVCRPAARHTRPRHLKHILIGFRLVSEVE